jgi:hypothetical protein
MAVLDDVRRLSQLDVMFLGSQFLAGAGIATTWYKGRLQQANDGNWVFRSVSADGTIAGFQLGPVGADWSSSESPGAGIAVRIPFTLNAPGAQLGMTLFLQQVLPQELT